MGRLNAFQHTFREIICPEVSRKRQAIPPARKRKLWLRKYRNSINSFRRESKEGLWSTVDSLASIVIPLQNELSILDRYSNYHELVPGDPKLEKLAWGWYKNNIWLYCFLIRSYKKWEKIKKENPEDKINSLKNPIHDHLRGHSQMLEHVL